MSEEFSHYEQPKTNLDEEELTKRNLQKLWSKEDGTITRGLSDCEILLENGRPYSFNEMDEYEFEGLSRRDFLEILKKGPVLDVACGEGRFVTDCINNGIDAYGVDLALGDKQGIDHIEKVNKRAKRRLLAADSASLPFKDNSFCAVTNFFGAPNYQLDPEKAKAVILEQLRVLQVGGKIIIFPVLYSDGIHPVSFVSELAFGRKKKDYAGQTSEENAVLEREKLVAVTVSNFLNELKKSGRIVIREFGDDYFINSGHQGGYGFIIIEKAWEPLENR
ncbi:MAG: class I SAM-dependent methyltransferase [Candidatus Berkelbacteria bacterium]